MNGPKHPHCDADAGMSDVPCSGGVCGVCGVKTQTVPRLLGSEARQGFLEIVRLTYSLIMLGEDAENSGEMIYDCDHLGNRHGFYFEIS